MLYFIETSGAMLGLSDEKAKAINEVSDIYEWDLHVYSESKVLVYDKQENDVSIWYIEGVIDELYCMLKDRFKNEVENLIDTKSHLEEIAEYAKLMEMLTD